MVGDTGCIYVEVASQLLALSKSLSEYAAGGVEFAAAILIALAALQAIVKGIVLFFRREATPQQKNEVRLTLGRWLALALEFELAADILNTAVTPSWSDIEKLAAIAAIRTALNYFLSKEIDTASKPAHQAAEQATMGPQASITAR